MIRSLGWSLLLLCCSSVLYAQEGRLDRVREEVSRPNDSPSKRDQDDNDCDEDNEWGEFLGELLGPCIFYGFAYAVASPFAIPYILLEDDWNTSGYFPGFPYAQGHKGYMHLGEPAENAPPPEPTTWFQGGRTRNWSLRLALEESSDFQGLDRLTGHLLLETTSRFGFQSSWTQLRECLCNGRSDELVLGDVNLVVRFAQHERAQFRAGIGLRTLIDDSATHWGFNFTYGADFYPVKPLIVSGQIDAGTLGSAGVFHGRATAGFNWSHFEVYGGYDFLRIGSVNLQGPVIGVCLWF